MLHIHDGDSTANMMRESGFPGEHFAFREALVSGPTPQGLSKDEWVAVRAAYLAEQAELDATKIERELSAMDATLASITNQEEVILWFEHDLFCQINLVYLLDRFAHPDLHPTNLSLICIGEFPGVANFSGLGQLTADQMASLFGTRHTVTEDESSLGQRAWAAYCSPDPREIEKLLLADTSALPFLGSALRQHLARFPSVRNGLGYAENKLLGFIAEGIIQFGSLCGAFFTAEPAYGLGDLQILRDLKRMAEGSQPLIRLDGFDDSSAAARLHATCDITETGQQVLAGLADFIRLNGIDSWLGGVHLANDTLWRWDEEKQLLRS